MSRRPAARLLATAGLVLGAAVAAAAQPSGPEPLDAATRERAARHQLQNGRALRAEGRLDAAERVLRRGLEIAPDDARLHRALARVLEAAGRPEDAASARARADALAPPAPSLPATPRADGTARALWIVPPGRDAELPAELPPDVLAATLADRARQRLPGLAVERGDATAVSEGRRRLAARGAGLVLSVRLERVFCGDTVKDGRFGVARLRVAAARRDAPVLAPRSLRHVVEDPRSPLGCAHESVARALEALLDLPEVARALADAPRAPRETAWSRTAVRAVFPGVGASVLAHVRRGRGLLASGELDAARAAFDAALEADPGDPHARAYRDEARRALAMTREIDARSGGGTPALDPRLSPAQRAAAEQALEGERHRHRELETALAVLDEDVRLPAPEALAGLRASAIRAPDAFGPRLARERAAGPVEARAAFAPDGSVIARYFVPAGGGPPLVREDDTDGDGSADRWVVYRDGVRREIFEDADGTGGPDSRFVFADGGEPLRRVELGLDAEGRPRHVLLYRDGALTAERADTDGDGALDRFDRLDADGHLALREEDLDGDGDVDVRSVFRAGTLERREIEDPAHVPDS